MFEFLLKVWYVPLNEIYHLKTKIKLKHMRVYEKSKRSKCGDHALTT